MIYSGEWDLITMSVTGYGHMQCSEQFMSMFKKGNFKDGVLNGKGI